MFPGVGSFDGCMSRLEKTGISKLFVFVFVFRFVIFYSFIFVFFV